MKNKILTISIIFILISCLFINNSVFAASYDLSHYQNIVESDCWAIVQVLSTNEIFFLQTNKSGYYLGTWGIYEGDDGYYYTQSGEFLATNNLSNMYSNQETVYSYKFNTSTNEFEYSGYNVAHEYINLGECRLIASSKNIYFPDDTSIFFQQTPVPSVVYIAPTTLAEELEKAQTVKTFQTMMSGIIPYLIAFLVGLVAFWKAWQLLLKELRKA